jgi:hypothetical protein
LSHYIREILICSESFNSERAILTALCQVIDVKSTEIQQTQCRAACANIKISSEWIGSPIHLNENFCQFT